MKVLRGHFEVMEHAARFIELSNDENAASEIMTGGNLTKILDFLPRRVRMTDDNLEVAETNATKRTDQYMKMKAWVTKTEKTLIVQGTKLDEKAETPVAMITTDSHISGRVQNSDSRPYQGNKSNMKRQQDRRNGRNQSQSDGKPVTECGFCTDVSQDYVQ